MGARELARASFTEVPQNARISESTGADPDALW